MESKEYVRKEEGRSGLPTGFALDNPIPLSLASFVTSLFECLAASRTSVRQPNAFEAHHHVRNVGEPLNLVAPCLHFVQVIHEDIGHVLTEQFHGLAVQFSPLRLIHL